MSDLDLRIEEALQWLRALVAELLKPGLRRTIVAGQMIAVLEEAARDRRSELARINFDATPSIGRQIDFAMAYAQSRKMAGVQAIQLTMNAKRELEDGGDPCVAGGGRRRAMSFRGLPIETVNGGVECALILCDGTRFVWRIDLPRRNSDAERVGMPDHSVTLDGGRSGA